MPIVDGDVTRMKHLSAALTATNPGLVLEQQLYYNSYERTTEPLPLRTTLGTCRDSARQWERTPDRLLKHV